MEPLLGVTYDASKHKTHEDWVESRIQTVEADALDQAEEDSNARTRYQRMFWEPVVEGTVCNSSILLSVSHPNLLLHQDPVVPNALNRAREDALRHGRSKESFKTVNATLDHPNRIREGTEATSTSDTAGGRPTIQFVDVGTKFIDPKDRLHRMKESERRARVRSKNVSKRHLMVA